MKYLFDTDGVVPKERATYWQEVVCETFVQLDCRIDRGESFRDVCTSTHWQI